MRKGAKHTHTHVQSFTATCATTRDYNYYYDYHYCYYTYYNHTTTTAARGLSARHHVPSGPLGDHGLVGLSERETQPCLKRTLVPNRK